MNKSNKELYKRIMRNVSKLVKHILNEDVNFNKFEPSEYQDEESSLISNQDIKQTSRLSRKEIVEELLGELVKLDVKINLLYKDINGWFDIDIDKNGNIILKWNGHDYSNYSYDLYDFDV